MKSIAVLHFIVNNALLPKGKKRVGVTMMLNS